MSLEKSIRELIEGRENIQAVPRPDNKDRKAIQNVGRTDSAHPTSDKSTLTRTAEIKNKVIDEKEQPMSGLKTSSTQDLYSKVLSILEGKEPKEMEKKEKGEKKEKEGTEVKLSGGKTEVETEPTTKSQAEVDKETEKEDEKAQKKAENGDKKKKEVKEELKGGQKKLDVAEPKGKLTSADFKKLRKEEVEEIYELSKKTLASYIGSASISKSHAAHDMGRINQIAQTSGTTASDRKERDALNKTHGKRSLGISRAANKLAKEDMDEARGVAAGAVDKHNCATHVYHEEFGEGKTIYSQHAEPDAEGNIAWYDVMFEHGIEREVSIDEMKIVTSESHGNHKKMKKEDVEQVDELSKGTLGSYVNKAAGSAATHTGAAAAYGSSSKNPNAAKMAQHQAIATKRTTGIQKAVNKLTKEEIEELDELSKKLVGRYIKKASDDISYKTLAAHDSKNSDQKRDQAGDKRHFRRKSLGTAVNKLTGQAKVNTTEEVEELDELDRQQGSIINRYLSKTNPDHSSPKEVKKRAPGRALALQKKWGDKNYGTSEPKVKAVTREDVEVSEDAVGSAQKSADQKMKAATITAKATVQADKIKDQARKQAQMNNSFNPENVDPIIEAAKKALVRISKNPAAPFNDAVKGVKGTDTRADSSD